MILNLYKNLKELVNFRGNDFVARQGPREIHGQNISGFLGQEMIAHRWNLQWEREWSGPTQALSKGPFHWLYSNLTSAPLALWLAAFSFSSTAFTFSQRAAPACWPLGTGVSLDLAGEREKYTVAY